MISNEAAVFDLVGRKDDLSRRIKKAAESALSFLGVKNSYLEIFLIDGRRMRGLNRKFRGKDRATNVLSFPASEPLRPGRKYLGEIFINPSFIEKKKDDHVLLIIHSLLHLLGYNHQKNNDRIRMERMERRIAQSLGLQP